MANHWQESQIEVSNFEAWLAASPLGSARHQHASTGYGNIAPSPATHLHSNVQTPVAGDPDLFISLPSPKDFRPPMYNATPYSSTQGAIPSPQMSQLDIPQFNNFGADNANSDMLLFISPKAMTFSQGFGLEPQPTTPFGGYRGKDIPFSGGFPTLDNTGISPMFSTVSKLDMPSMDDELAMDKSSQLVMLHHSSSLPQFTNSHASSSSFSLNNEEEVGIEENAVHSHGRLLHRAHSEDTTTSSSSNNTRISEIASSCHHCKRRRHPNELKPCHRNGAKIDRNGAEAVASRRTCRKRYCLGCLQKYGITFAEAEQAGWTCMACRGVCECAACRRKGH
jgi:hypothetical protein